MSVILSGAKNLSLWIIARKILCCSPGCGRRRAFAKILPAFMLALLTSFSGSAQSMSDELVKAAADGRTTDVERLLTQRVSPNAISSGKFGVTALMQAAQGGHSNVVWQLLNHGVDLNTRESRTALDWAVSKHYFQIANLLMERGTDPKIALIQCCSEGDGEALRFLLERRVPITVEDENGSTPLNSAGCYGRTNIVEILLEAGASANSNNLKDGLTPLMYAVSPRGNFEVVKKLLAHGANVNTKSPRGWTALMGAAANGHTDIAKLLLDQHAEVRAQDAEGQTALQLAVKSGHVDVARLLQGSRK